MEVKLVPLSLRLCWKLETRYAGAHIYVISENVSFSTRTALTTRQLDKIPDELANFVGS